MMSSTELWNQISAELNRLRSDDNFKLFRGTLERLENLTNVGRAGTVEVSPQEVRNAVDLIKGMQQEVMAGANPRQVFENALANSQPKTLEPERSGDRMVALGDIYKAQGDVNQAERDVIKAGADVYIFNTQYLLSETLKEIKRNSDQIMVQVVLLVMTAQEAQQLRSEEVFARFGNSVYYQQISSLREQLTRAQIAEVLDRYGPTPEEWRPFSGSQETIREGLTKALAKVQGFNKPLAPDLRDIRQLAPETDEEPARASLKFLREEGCMVIMDVVSMHHPAIQRAYRRSLLDVYSNVPVMRLTPFPTLHGLDDQEMLHFGDRYCDMEIFKRLNWDTDDSVREGDRAPAFLRWIVGNVPEMLRRREYYKNAQANVQSSYKGPDGAA